MIHFVNDAEDIQKTFVSEIDSLLAPAASKLALEVKLKNNCQVEVFGYQPVKFNNRYLFELDDLNHGATQVVLFETKGNFPVASATLTGIDAVTRKKFKLKVNNQLISTSEGYSYSVRRNYGIGLIGKALKQASQASNRGDCRGAEKILKQGLNDAACQVDGEVDKHLKRMVSFAKDYRSKILDCIERFGD